MITATVIDYGMGNLLSVQRAFEHCGAAVKLVSTAAEVQAATHLVLPGVGAFGDGMEALRKLGLVDAIRAHHAAGKPLLGICLGMQMILETSEEFGTHAGLGLLPGKLSLIPLETKDGARHKVPHLGWAEIRPAPGRDWAGTALADLKPGDAVYFMHSFMASPPSVGPAGLAATEYGGIPIAAVVHRGETIGCQFHPEKSGPNGLKIIRAFLARGLGSRGSGTTSGK